MTRAENEIINDDVAAVDDRELANTDHIIIILDVADAATHKVIWRERRVQLVIGGGGVHHVGRVAPAFADDDSAAARHDHAARRNEGGRT